MTFLLSIYVTTFLILRILSLYQPPMSQYATYSRFHSPEDAQFLIALLQQRNIPFTLEHEVNQLDKVYHWRVC